MAQLEIENTKARQLQDDEWFARMIALEEDERIAQKLQRDYEAGIAVDDFHRPMTSKGRTQNTDSSLVTEILQNDALIPIDMALNQDKTEPIKTCSSEKIPVNLMNKTMLAHSHASMPTKSSVETTMNLNYSTCTDSVSSLHGISTVGPPQPDHDCYLGNTAVQTPIFATSDTRSEMTKDANVAIQTAKSQSTKLECISPSKDCIPDYNKPVESFFDNSLEAAVSIQGCARVFKHQQKSEDIVQHSFTESRIQNNDKEYIHEIKQSILPIPSIASEATKPSIDVDQDPNSMHAFNSLDTDLNLILKFINDYTPQHVDSIVMPYLKCQIPDYIAAIGNTDPFLKMDLETTTKKDIKTIPKPSKILGLQILDEPSSKQSQSAAVELTLRATQLVNIKNHPLNVQSIQVHHATGKIDQWIQSVETIHGCLHNQTIYQGEQLPYNIEHLLLEWPKEIENALSSSQSYALNTRSKSLIRALESMFTVYVEFSQSHHFGNES
ncbi:Intraflagellar transport protein 46 [Batrachochytrium dendrobatidis]|nr:Intraflagellar transport protein 46 [Batrachochytrium dendrobatidis]